MAFSGLRWAVWLLAVGAMMLSEAAAQVLPEDVLAVVEGDTIYVDAFEATYAAYLVETGRNDTEGLRRAHLENLIDEHLLAAEAQRRGLAAGEAYAQVLSMARAKAVGARYFEQRVLDSLPPPTDAELRRAYARSQERIVLRHAVYPTERAAREALARIERGTTLLALAQERFGTPASDSLAGLLGGADYFELDDAVAEAAFAATPGTVAGPVRSRYGWHLLEVLDRLYNPLLTEADYQRRRDGLASRLRERRRRLEGDAFVRAFMEARAVRVDPAAVRQLSVLLKGEDAQPDAPIHLDLSEAARDTPLAPETPLLTYEWAGVRRPFTLADYARWLPDLPPDEAKQRTAASVGRALRNEVFAVAGEAAGLADAATVRQAVAAEKRGFLAGRLRDTLAANPIAMPDTALMTLAARRLGLLGRARLTATFWAVPFENRAAATEARSLIASNPEYAAELPGYVAFTDADVTTDPRWSGLVSRAPLGEPVVVGRGDGSWLVLHVSERKEEMHDLPELRSALEPVLAPLATEAALLHQLRAQAAIIRNEAAFQALLVF